MYRFEVGKEYCIFFMGSPGGRATRGTVIKRTDNSIVICDNYGNEYRRKIYNPSGEIEMVYPYGKKSSMSPFMSAAMAADEMWSGCVGFGNLGNCEYNPNYEYDEDDWVEPEGYGKLNNYEKLRIQSRSTNKDDTWDCSYGSGWSFLNNK